MRICGVFKDKICLFDLVWEFLRDGYINQMRILGKCTLSVSQRWIFSCACSYSPAREEIPQISHLILSQYISSSHFTHFSFLFFSSLFSISLFIFVSSHLIFMFIVFISLIYFVLYLSLLFPLFILLYLLFFPVLGFDLSHLFYTVLLLSDFLFSFYSVQMVRLFTHLLVLGPVYTRSLNVFSLIG